MRPQIRDFVFEHSQPKSALLNPSSEGPSAPEVSRVVLGEGVNRDGVDGENVLGTKAKPKTAYSARQGGEISLGLAGKPVMTAPSAPGEASERAMRLS